LYTKHCSPFLKGGGPLAVEDFFTYHRLPLLRGNVACDKGVKIPLGYAVSPFKKGEQKSPVLRTAPFSKGAQ